MIKVIINIINKIVAQRPSSRKLWLISIDILLLFISIPLALYLQSKGNTISNIHQYNLIVVIMLGLGALIYLTTGQYSSLTRYVGSKSIYKLVLRNTSLIIGAYSISFILGFNILQTSTWLLTWLILNSLATSSRFFLRDILIRVINVDIRKRICIYGAGYAGIQIAASIRLSKKYDIIYFIDDDSSLWGRNINGITILSPDGLSKNKSKIDQVVIAIPSLKKKRLQEIVDIITKEGLEVSQIPSLDDITEGNLKINSIRPIAIEELLGRDVINPNFDLLGPGITGCNVCVTGAGGTIGSELCRQIYNLKPSKLILLENSEVSLYKIHQELVSLNKESNLIYPVLGSASDLSLLTSIFKKHQISFLLHCSAYKHVPLVEINPLQGIKNNAISTKVICEASELSNVKKVILISTDKAVRPTNIMGASKRLAELIIQAYGEKQNKLSNGTCYSMVRFGNVLGSSGSVVPLFKKQISEGGPITLTHKDIVRYFMTIPEAAQLVLQASVLAKGGDLFHLDMGDPIKIYDLACEMIKLSGKTLKEKTNPDGDIEIITTGLRPGEKLFEELLIDSNAKETIHPLIFTAIEKSIPYEVLLSKIKEIESHINQNNVEKSLDVLKSVVPEWEKSKN